MEMAGSSWRKVDVLVRWHVDRGLAVIRKCLPGMAESREGPKDYEDEEDLRNLVRLAVRAGGQHYHEGPPGGSTKTIVISVSVVIISSFLIGVWAFSNRFSALEARFSEWQKAVDRRMDAQDQRLDRLENRR
jgi:hypothetical protein